MTQNSPVKYVELSLLEGEQNGKRVVKSALLDFGLNDVASTREISIDAARELLNQLQSQLQFIDDNPALKVATI